MAKPLVAVVGRPNVGKSTFFNRVVGRRVAIVEDVPGVTRDRIYADVDWGRYQFSLIDTGGIDLQAEDEMREYIKEQAELAMDLAEVIVLFVDGKSGLTGDDRDVADMLRRTKKPVVIAVNKLDNPKNFDNAYEFYELGIGEVVPVSCTLGLGVNDLLDAIVTHLELPEEQPEEEERICISVIGKPNVGKSSLVNKLLGQTRVIVSNIPGTTRDAIDTPLERDGEKYTIIDTAGMRRKRSIEEDSIERYSVVRSLAAARRSDVVLIVIDASVGLTEQDVKIAGFAHEEGKACVLIVNKWDLVEKDTHTMNAFREKIMADLAFMSYVPMLFISAKTGQRVDRIFELIRHVYGQSVLRIATGMLNEVINEAIRIAEPPSDRGRRLKILYATQVSIKPPTFVLFVNEPELMHFSYKRYLENYLRKTFGFEGTAIRFLIRKRDK